MMSPTLALRCDLAVDESVSSWVSRLARVNGIDSASEFCLDMGLTLEGCDHGKPAALARLCDLTGTPLSLLERASLRTDGYGRNLRGELLAPRMLRRSGIALCPQCIAEAIRYEGERWTATAYGRTLWQLSVVRSCARHGCALVEIPPDCDAASADFTAHVRDSLKTIRRHAEAPEPLPVSALQAYVEDRLEGHERETSWLDGMNLSAAVEICEALGILLMCGARTKLRRLSEEELHRAGDVGFQVMTQGETAIRASLTAISNSIPVQRRSRDGYSSRFGILYRSLAARRNNPAFAPMRTLLYQHIVETMPVGPGDTVLGLPVEKRVMHSIVTASRETGRHPKRLRKVLGAAGLIPPNHETLSDQYVKFDASTASDTLEANTTSLLLTDAAAYLHTSEQQMRMFTRKGFIRTYVERRRGDRARLLTYAIKDLDAFMARLTMHAEPIDHPSKMMVSIPVAARRAKCEAATIIRWVLNKRVTRVRRHTGSEQYASILVDIREIIRQNNISVEGYVSIREAAGLLRRHRMVVERLIADGHLSFVDGKFPSNNVSAKLIAKSEIQEFRDTYISLQEIARKLDIPKGWVAYRMGSIKPVIEQSRVGATYYRRDSVPNV